VICEALFMRTRETTLGVCLWDDAVLFSCPMTTPQSPPCHPPVTSATARPSSSPAQKASRSLLRASLVVGRGDPDHHTAAASSLAGLWGPRGAGGGWGAGEERRKGKGGHQQQHQDSTRVSASLKQGQGGGV
jgi:hypothetical protein